MTDNAAINDDVVHEMANQFGSGIDDALALERPEYVTSTQMAEAHWRVGAICGHAIKIAELVGEENVASALNISLRFVEGHFENLRNGLVRTSTIKKAN